MQSEMGGKKNRLFLLAALADCSLNLARFASLMVQQQKRISTMQVWSEWGGICRVTDSKPYEEPVTHA